MSGPQPWDRLEGESDVEYRLFCDWLFLPLVLPMGRLMRMHPAMHSSLKGGKNTLASLHELRDRIYWRERAAAYDDYIEERRILAVEERARLKQETEDFKIVRAHAREKLAAIESVKAAHAAESDLAMTMSHSERQKESRDEASTPAVAQAEAASVQDLSTLSDEELATLQRAHEITGSI